MTVSLCLPKLAERVMSGCVPKLTGAGREGYEWLCPYAYWSWQRGLRVAVFLSLLELAERVKSGCVSLCLLELAERVMGGCVHKPTGAGREGYEWLCP